MSRLLKNSLFSSSSYFIIVLIAFVTTPYVVAKLGIADYGIYILLTSLVGYYSLLDLGFNQGVTKYVAEFREKNEPESVSRSINASLLVQLMLGCTASLLLVAFATPILVLLKVDAPRMAEARTGVYACSAGFFFTMISGTFNAVLAGLQRYDLTGKVDSLINLLLTVMTVLLLFLGFGLTEVVCATVISALISTGVYFAFVRKLVPEWRFSVRFDREYFRLIFGFSSFMFMSKISSVFSNYVVRFVISYFLGPAVVTLYVIPSKLLAAFGGVLGSAAGVIFPYASQLSVSDSAKLKEVFYKGSTIFAAISIPIFLFIMVFSHQILQLWMGKGIADQSYLVLSIITLSGLIASQTVVPNLVICGLGYTRLIGFFGILAVVCYMAFLPVLTQAYGIIGTSAGMLLTTVINVFFVFKLTTEKIGIPYYAYLKSVFGFHALPCLFSLAALYAIMANGLEGSLAVAGAGCLLLAVYFAIMVKKDILPLAALMKRKAWGFRS